MEPATTIADPPPLVDDIPVAPASFLEQALMFTLVGYPVGYHLYKRRHFPRYTRLEKQLLARTKPDPIVWGDERRQEIAAVLCEAFQKEFLWPNDHFIPADTIAMVVWPHQIRVEREFIFAMAEVGSRLRATIPPLANRLLPTSTLAELVTFIASAPRSSKAI